MTTMTAAQAEKARKELAAFEAKQAADARTAENEKRATAREAFKPLADLAPELSAVCQKLQGAIDTGLPGERGLADLARNVCITIEGLTSRLERRVADTEPVPEPEAAPAPTPQQAD